MPKARRKPPGRPKPKALTAKQRRFVTEVIRTLRTGRGNLAEAARRAGYSARSARVRAQEAVSNRNVREAIHQREVKLLQLADITDERLIVQAGRIALTDRRGYFREDGKTCRPLSELTEDEAACLVGFQVVKGNLDEGDGLRDTVHKYQLEKPSTALELLMRHRQLLRDTDPANEAPKVPTFVFPPGTKISFE